MINPELLDYLLNAAMILIMFSIGAALRFSDFRRIFWSLRELFTGLVLQMLFLPFVAFLIVLLFDIDPYFKMGIMLVAICPGGATSNFISYLVNADVALSVLLTTINSILILITIPLLSNLFLDYFLHESSEFSLPFDTTLGFVFLVILLPACVGLLLNHYYPNIAEHIRMPLKIFNVVFLALIYLGKALFDTEHGGVKLDVSDIMILLPVTVLIQLISMIGAYRIAGHLIKRNSSALTIGIEVGLQNTTLALIIATNFLQSPDMGKPALVFSLFSFMTTLIFAWVVYQWVIIPHRRSFVS